MNPDLREQLDSVSAMLDDFDEESVPSAWLG
jgi:hypothetical protein